jgi:hypothetical protein
MVDASRDTASGSPTASPGLRASDADRDATVGVLNEGLVLGRLTTEEHAARVDSALRAKTLGDLSTLTEDLASTSPRRDRNTVWRRLVPVLVLVSVLVVVAVLIGRHGPTSPAQRAGNSGSKSDGFVQPQPALAGKFCGQLLRAQSSTSATGILGIAPGSDPWGTQTLIVPKHPTQTYVHDFAAVQSLENATSVVQMAWQKNGYQYAGLTLACMSAYDSHFDWIAPSASSTGPTAISADYTDRHSVVAARSASGACWFEVNVMGPGDPVISQFSLQSYGVYFATGGSRCSADAAPSQPDWELADPLPPQLGP